VCENCRCSDASGWNSENVDSVEKCQNLALTGNTTAHTISFRTDVRKCHYATQWEDCNQVSTSNSWVVYHVYTEQPSHSPSERSSTLTPSNSLPSLSPTLHPTLGESTCAIRWNQFPNLEPPGRSMWRGTTYAGGPLSAEEDFGLPVHVFRKFAGVNWFSLTEDERAFVNNGGIMWYGIAFNDWAAVINGNFDSEIRSQFAGLFKSLDPAQLFVCLRWESDLYVDPDRTDKYYGTNEEYRLMWAHFQDIMQEEGVTNVQYALDWSAHTSREQNGGVYAAQWPGDDRVDWLFWNFFQFGSDLEKDFYEMTSSAYNFFEESSCPH